ncbi:MAG: hypothetical protein ACFWUC_09910 [Oscillospiraceae bacterium]
MTDKCRTTIHVGTFKSFNITLQTILSLSKHFFQYNTREVKHADTSILSLNADYGCAKVL